MILEAIITTADATGAVNIAPMGPEVTDGNFRRITLKPFRSSRTFANLRHSGTAVVHVTDDVELIAATATGAVDPLGLVEGLLGDGLLGEGRIPRWHKLVDCCHWYAVEVESWSDDPLRPHADCRIVHHGIQRPMFGLNRAKHAVVEAAILVTRLGLLGRDEVLRQMRDLRPLVDKTGGAAEHRAWQHLESVALRPQPRDSESPKLETPKPESPPSGAT